MDKKVAIGELLHSHGLKKTPIRSEILEIFMENEYALSVRDLISKMNLEKDRVTVYRALASFEENGIVHKASEDCNGAKYALCSLDGEGYSQNHAHFICERCHQIYCLEDLKIPEFNISDKFVINRVTFTLSGLCKGCLN